MISLHPESAPRVDVVLPRLITPRLGALRTPSTLIPQETTDAAARVLGSLAILDVSPSGHIGFATEKASLLLQKYFPSAGRSEVSQVPALLLQSLRKSATELSMGPVGGLFDQGSNQLIIRITGREDGFFQLLLEERSDEVIAKRLTELGLTPKESEVLLWMTRGKTDAEIATIVGCRPRTVNKHAEQIRAKLGVETRTAAAAVAQELITLSC